MPEQRDDERQANRGLGSGHRHHEEGDDLAVDVAGIAPERHERQVHGVQHDLYRQQDRDQVAAQEHACRANREEHRRDDQVMTEGNHWSLPSRLARTTAPTIATRISTDVASNANVCRVKRTRPISRTELTDAASLREPTGALSSPTFASAQTSCTISSVARSAPNLPMLGCANGCDRSYSAASSRGALSSITTKRKSTIMAPA